MPTLDELIAGARAAKPAHRDVDVTLDRAVAEQLEKIDAEIEELEGRREELAEQLAADLAELQRDARLGDNRAQDLQSASEQQTAEIDGKIDALVADRERLTEGTLITVRFTQLPGQDWAAICARNPEREDVIIDRIYHYDYHAVAREAAGWRDVAGRRYSERVLPAEEGAEPLLEPITAEQWTALLELISGHEFERIASALWDLNDYGPQQRIANAGKASRAVSASKST